MLDKSGEAISPFEVVEAGNRHMHAVGRGFARTAKAASGSRWRRWIGAGGDGRAEGAVLLERQPDLTAGMQSNLYNNAWGTNYIMW